MELATVVDVVLLVAAVIILLPISVLVIESFLALLPRHATPIAVDALRPRGVVLVPAHNEQDGIAPTIQSILPQLRPEDRLIVVADNCSDRTAEMARAAGAAVLERHDTTRRGKGYALDFGVRSLEADPPGVVVIIDADCIASPGTVDCLIRQAAETRRPVQGADLLEAPPNAGVRDRLSAFAFLFKNVVRPLGLSRLGCPCLLMGTGMALPWEIICGIPLATGNLVEDMQLGLELSLRGSPPSLCLDACVQGQLPSSGRAATTQRTRWEHGHLQTLLTQVPRLIGQAIRLRRPDLLGLALELGVPPLSMVCLAWALGLVAAVGWWAVGGWALPAWLLVGGGMLLFLGVVAAWAKFGRATLPFTSLLATPFYILWKVPIYVAYFVRRQQAWVRTERDRPAAPPETTA